MCTGLAGLGGMVKIITAREAAELVQDDAVIGSTVQGMTGWSKEIGLAIENRFMGIGYPSDVTHTHEAGQEDFGRMSEDGKAYRGECALTHDGLFSCSIHGHVRCPFKVTKQIVDNKISAHSIPLGVVGQIWREVERGFPGLLIKVGLSTFMDPRYDEAIVNEEIEEEGRGPSRILRQRGPLQLSLWPDIKRTS